MQVSRAGLQVSNAPAIRLDSSISINSHCSGHQGQHHGLRQGALPDAHRPALGGPATRRCWTGVELKRLQLSQARRDAAQRDQGRQRHAQRHLDAESVDRSARPFCPSGRRPSSSSSPPLPPKRSATLLTYPLGSEDRVLAFLVMFAGPNRSPCARSVEAIYPRPHFKESPRPRPISNGHHRQKLGHDPDLRRTVCALASPSFTPVSASCCRSARHKHGYAAVRIGYGEKPVRLCNRPKAAARSPSRTSRSALHPRDPPRCQAAESVRSRRGAAAVEDSPGTYVDVVGTSRGGFQGVIKASPHGRFGEQPRLARVLPPRQLDRLPLDPGRVHRASA